MAPKKTEETTLQSITDQLNTIEKTLKELTHIKNDIKSVKKSLKTCVDTLVKQTKTLETLSKDNKTLKEDNVKLKSDVKRLNDRLEDLEQYGRRNNVEIQGIPEARGENLLHTITTLGVKMGCKIEASDVDVVHRLPARNQEHKPIIVKFVRRTVKLDLLNNRSRLAQVTSQDFDSTSTGNKVYVNENLTPYRKQLFYLARNKKKDSNYKYVWVKNGNVFMRKLDGHDAIKITCEEDLANL